MAHRRYDLAPPPPEPQRGWRGRYAAGLIAGLALAGPGFADTLRVATYQTDLSRKGPGLLARDIASGNDPQTEAVVAVIAAAAPDVIVLQGIDYDYGLAALGELNARLSLAGATYPYAFALRPNTGMLTDLDLDGDGRLRGARDAQGFGYFAGSDAMAILSKLPLDAEAAQDYSAMLWRDLPGSLIDGAGLTPEALAVQRLATTAHWAVPVVLPGGARLTLLAWHATPPVFDGPEDRNGRRNHDEAAFWLRLLDGSLPYPPPAAPYVVIGDSNLDPLDGEGRRAAMTSLLADPRLLDPAPASKGGPLAATVQGGPNAAQKGDPALDTADWDEARGIGNMRVDYVLPSADLTVTASGVWWPAPTEPGAAEAEAASHHKLVWVDIALP